MSVIKKKATFENLDFILNFVRDKLSKIEIDDSTFSDIILAVEELVVNVISYAFPNAENGEIELSFYLESNSKIVIEIIDNGIPFDVKAAKKPDTTTPIHKRGIGGMGIFLVKNVVDDLDYKRENGKNRLVIKKSISS